jgi:hypothetical protein
MACWIAWDASCCAVGAQGGHRVVAGQAANADRLPFIVEAELSLTCQYNMFEGLAVHCV